MKNFSVEREGIIIGACPDATFRVQLDNGSEILGDTSRQVKKNYTPIEVGDRVKVGLTSSGSTAGCITHRIPKSFVSHLR